VLSTDWINGTLWWCQDSEEFLSLICAAEFLCFKVRSVLEVLYGKHRILFFFQGFFLCLESFRFIGASRLTAPQYTSFLYVSFMCVCATYFHAFWQLISFAKTKMESFLFASPSLFLSLVRFCFVHGFCFCSFQCNNGSSFQLLVLQESELRLAELCGRKSATPYMAKSINSRIY